MRSSSINTNTNNELTEWSLADEKYLEKLHLQCYDLYMYWNERSKYYKSLNIKYNMPIVIISGINSVFALMLAKYINQETVSNINAGLSMLTTIVGSIKLLLRITEQYSNALISAVNFNKLCIKISKELSISRDTRILSGKDFVNECYADYIDSFDKADQLDISLIKFPFRLLLNKDKENNTPSKVTRIAPLIRWSTMTNKTLNKQQKAATDTAQKYLEPETVSNTSNIQLRTRQTQLQQLSEAAEESVVIDES